MSEPIQIRPLTRADRAVWQALWRAYLQFYKTELPDEVYDATFDRYSDPENASMRGWIAWRGDEALGLVHAIAHAHGWRLNDVTYLQDLFTVPEARGQGVARALIETVYADADAEGREAVYWLTQTDNATARALYDRIATPSDFMVYKR